MPFHRQESLAAHLEMEMVRGAGSALWAVVEDCHVGECLGETEHVGEASGNPLRHVVHGRYGKVLGENGEWVDQYLVAAAVAALEGHGLLPAMEAASVRARVETARAGLYWTLTGIPPMVISLVFTSRRSLYLRAASGHPASCLSISPCIVSVSRPGY